MNKYRVFWSLSKLGYGRVAKFVLKKDAIAKYKQLKRSPSIHTCKLQVWQNCKWQDC